MPNPYQKHEFTDGAKLYAAQLTEMDNQIAANDAACRTLNLDTILNIINEQMQKLSLNTDGTYISLSFDNVETNSVAVVNAEDIDFATSLSVTSDHTLTLDAGETSQIIASSLPQDNNQTIRFRSNDFNVLKVNNNGLITALHFGKTSVSVICGQYTVPIQVAVRGIKTPTWRIGTYIGQDKNDMTKFRMSISDSDRLIAFPAENDNILLHTGETISIDMDRNDGYIAQVFAIPKEGVVLGTDTNNDVPIITLPNTSVLSNLKDNDDLSQNWAFTYTAEEDCYIAIAIGPTPTHDYDVEERDNFNNSNACIIKITPAAV